MKFYDFEGGLKVPAFVYAPGRVQGGSSYEGLLHHVDWMATFLSLAGSSLEGCDDCDSLDHWDGIAAGSSDAYPRPRRIFCSEKSYFSRRRLHGLSTSWPRRRRDLPPPKSSTE